MSIHMYWKHSSFQSSVIILCVIAIKIPVDSTKYVIIQYILTALIVYEQILVQIMFIQDIVMAPKECNAVIIM